MDEIESTVQVYAIRYAAMKCVVYLLLLGLARGYSPTMLNLELDRRVSRSPMTPPKSFYYLFNPTSTHGTNQLNNSKMMVKNNTWLFISAANCAKAMIEPIPTPVKNMSQFVSERLAVLYKKIHPDISMTNSEVSVKIRQRFVNWNRPSGKLTKLSKIQASRSSRLKAVCDFLDAPFIVHSDTPTPRGTPITPGETSTPEENFTATPENLSRKRHLASATPAS
eukprot:237304_1